MNDDQNNKLSDEVNNDNNQYPVNPEDTKPPSVKGEESISGETPDPESDDNVLDAAHKAGLYTESDEEHPHEVDLANEVDEAEKERVGIEYNDKAEMPKRQE